MEVTIYTITGEMFKMQTDEEMTIVKFCKLINDNIFVYDDETCVKSDSIIAFTLEDEYE